MQEMGICRPSNSAWSSPLHVVAKKNGDIRPCGDFRRLNAITKLDRYPVPRLQDFTYVLAGKKIFSKLDINKSYHCVKVAKEDIEKTAIITPFGLFDHFRATKRKSNIPTLHESHGTKRIRLSIQFRR